MHPEKPHPQTTLSPDSDSNRTAQTSSSREGNSVNRKRSKTKAIFLAPFCLVVGVVIVYAKLVEYDRERRRRKWERRQARRGEGGVGVGVGVGAE